MERFDFVEDAWRRWRGLGSTYIRCPAALWCAWPSSEVGKKYDGRRAGPLSESVRREPPLGREVAEKFKERFPDVSIIQGYGLTESTGGVAALDRIVSNAEARVVDPSTGEALGPGQQGELWLRAPMIMMGYVGDEQATTSTLTSDGWLKTGDLGYFDQDGFLFIVDRLKELIKYKAYQVPPAELEQILQSHKDIADAAVIPYPDEEAGEIPMAFVVRQPGSTINEGKIMDYVAKQVAPYKKIRRVAFISSIPKSAAGKILRRELVQQALSKPTSKL
ncbi:uncharacterized protein A4U43_C03F27550 [Asparagus officinalis]|uniref:4-coumarate--CoA ligase n=1 Tax=Asparagus officinalis TaxID=4686 RepID=A0A5P1FFB2_ASPOF|nr:4-coumarate--CoA ligase-like 9 [Asparagus officinalis]ONK76413.1 uncharacterized protein A4U43_C03F27550 [Asparagus officinalis]